MEQVVYADLLFLIDFSMDFLTFCIVSRILRQKIKLIRVCSASAMGGIYSVMALNISVGNALALFFDIFICFVMCMTAFLERDLKKFRMMPIYTGLFFLSSAMLGGIMTSIYSLLNQQNFSVEKGTENNPSLWVFGFVALFSAITTIRGSNWLTKLGKTKTGKLMITIYGKSVTLSAFSDSGNLLKDPIGGKDVIVVDRVKTLPIVSELSDGISKLSSDMSRRVRMIPVNTATGTGILIGFVADSVKLYYGDSVKELDVIIALSKDRLGGENCEAILPPEYFS